MNISKPRHCPACGGEITAGMDECPHCTLPFTMDGGAERTMCQCRITEERVIEIARNWWAGLLMAYDLNRKCHIDECSLKYVPFWKLRARARGYVKGYALQSGETDVDLCITIDRSYVWNEIACDFKDFGMKHVGSLDCGTRPYDANLAQVSALTVSKRTAMTDGISAIEEKAVNSAGVPHITSKSVTAVPTEMSLVFYPVWTLRYSYHDEAYSVIVDGVTGDIVAGRAPGDYTLMRISAAAGLLIGTAMVLLVIYVIRIGSSMEVLYPIAGIAAICLILAYEAFSFYSNGPVICCGGFHDGYRPFNYFVQKKLRDTSRFIRIDKTGERGSDYQS
jgi:hypothetical protein